MMIEKEVPDEARLSHSDSDCDEIAKLSQDIAGPEVERAKAQLKAGILMSRESSAALLASDAGHFRPPRAASSKQASCRSVGS